MTNPTNTGGTFSPFQRVVAGVGGLIVAGLGVKIVLGGQISDRSGWSMEAPTSSAIIGGLFILSGLGAVLASFFWRRKKPETITKTNLLQQPPES